MRRTVMMRRPVERKRCLTMFNAMIGKLGVSELLIILLMYCGRIGSMSFALAFTQSKRITRVRNPVERINVG